MAINRTVDYLRENKQSIKDQYEKNGEQTTQRFYEYYKGLETVPSEGELFTLFEEALKTIPNVLATSPSEVEKVAETLTAANLRACDLTTEMLDKHEGQDWQDLVAEQEVAWPVYLIGHPGYLQALLFLIEEIMEEQGWSKVNSE